MSSSFISKFIQPVPWPESHFQIPQFQSHRGYHLEGTRENTLASIVASAQLGAEMCEFDVQLCQEGIPILFHDEEVQNEFGEKKKIAEIPLKELKSKWEVNTLEEILTSPDATKYFNIELKTKKADDPLTRKVSEVVKRTGSEKRILFSSFNPFALWMSQSYLPEVPRALLVSNTDHPSNSWYLREMLFAPLLKLHMLNLEHKMLTPELIQYWKKKNMPLSAWTVNDPERIKFFLEQGVQSVISDLKPEVFLLTDKTE